MRLPPPTYRQRGRPRILKVTIQQLGGDAHEDDLFPDLEGTRKRLRTLFPGSRTGSDDHVRSLFSVLVIPRGVHAAAAGDVRPDRPSFRSGSAATTSASRNVFVPSWLSRLAASSTCFCTESLSLDTDARCLLPPAFDTWRRGSRLPNGEAGQVDTVRRPAEATQDPKARRPVRTSTEEACSATAARRRTSGSGPPPRRPVRPPGPNFAEGTTFFQGRRSSAAAGRPTRRPQRSGAFPGGPAMAGLAIVDAAGESPAGTQDFGGLLKQVWVGNGRSSMPPQPKSPRVCGLHCAT